MKQLIRTYYNKGLYSKEDLLIFVNVKILTEEEYKEIIGEIEIKADNLKIIG